MDDILSPHQSHAPPKQQQAPPPPKQQQQQHQMQRSGSANAAPKQRLGVPQQQQQQQQADHMNALFDQQKSGDFKYMLDATIAYSDEKRVNFVSETKKELLTIFGQLGTGTNDQSPILALLKTIRDQRSIVKTNQF